MPSSDAPDFRDKPSAPRQDGATSSAAVTDREPQAEVSIAVDYGCIVILVYYLQDSQLLNVKTVYTSRCVEPSFSSRTIVASNRLSPWIQ